MPAVFPARRRGEQAHRWSAVPGPVPYLTPSTVASTSTSSSVCKSTTDANGTVSPLRTREASASRLSTLRRAGHAVRNG